MVIQHNHLPISLSSSNHTNCIMATCRLLRHLRSGHTSVAQTQAVLLVPSLTKIPATHLRIANSSRSPNIEIFGHVALPMSLGCYFKVFESTRAPTPVPSSRNWMSQKDARISMAVLFAIIILRRTNHTGLGSPWVMIALTTLGTRARPLPISPQQNSFSTPLSLLLAHCSTASTLPISI
jgi:hypothetical protein